MGSTLTSCHSAHRYGELELSDVLAELRMLGAHALLLVRLQLQQRLRWPGAGLRVEIGVGIRVGIRVGLRLRAAACSGACDAARSDRMSPLACAPTRRCLTASIAVLQVKPGVRG